MKKLCVVPFTRRELPLLPSLKKQFQISSIVTPQGIGFEGEDVSSLKNLDPTGFAFTNDLDRGIDSSDTVLIAHVPSKYLSLRKYALQALNVAVHHGKDIYCFLELSEEEKRAIEGACEQSKSSITYFSSPDVDDKNVYEFQRLHKFTVPVIYVCEEVPDCDGYDSFLAVAEKLSAEGKTVLAISEDSYNSFLGYECMKFGAQAEIGNQVFRLNTMIYNLCQEKHPDIILILLPQPLMKYDDESLFDCGGIAFILSQAVPGDGCIYCTHAEVNGGIYWETFNNGILSKFGYPIICVNVSNRIIDNAGDIHLSSLRIPEKETVALVNSIESPSGIPFFHLQNANDLHALYQKILDEYMDLPYGVI